MRTYLGADHARNLVFLTGIQFPDAEVSGVQKPAFVLSIALNAEDAANLAGGQRVKNFIIPGATRNRVDNDWNFNLIGVVRPPAPEHAAGHETGAKTLGLPRVALADLLCSVR